MTMTDSIRITDVEQDGEDGLIMTFSDRTTGAYVVKELQSCDPSDSQLRSRRAIILRKC